MCCRIEGNFEVPTETEHREIKREAEEDCPIFCVDKDDPFTKQSLDKSQPKYAVCAPRCKETLDSVAAKADHDQQNSTEGITKRARVLEEAREQLACKIKLLREEFTLLESERQRIMRALNTLQLVEYISSECSTKRTVRVASDLIRDGVDVALEKEAKICSEVRHLWSLLLAETVDQLQSINICKNQLEFDWSDKTEAYRLETTNMGLKNTSANISFYSGVARFPANQSDEEQWELYYSEQLKSGQTTIDRTKNLRKRIEEGLKQSVFDLRKQADCVELQMKRNIEETQNKLQEAENTLQKILMQITETESLEANLRRLGRQADLTLKVAQTRLYNREHRPRVEQTRDSTQFGLIEEVKNLNASSTRITNEIENANETAAALYHSRALLQRNIAVKKKSLYVDALRCQSMRLRYPDTNALCGYV